jgi:hypothetical protein
VGEEERKEGEGSEVYSRLKQDGWLQRKAREDLKLKGSVRATQSDQRRRCFVLLFFRRFSRSRALLSSVVGEAQTWEVELE